ncbi:MFS transporter [Dyella nitratireducens]|uniref:MFS transporter n=1 Tax=Dyella nitratireducens TaxID=1849580 RepID=A0ABQ1FV51_9GAMM|nr:MFS transporter [Dyella nitratireducens]GGA30478.1 MFS transporter [Dyella nitratireducens]GLQ43001.1 MFS transporter [Dyella nitratireducens]
MDAQIARADATFSGRNVMALAAVCLAALMSGLEISSVPVILPTLQQILQANFRDLEWIENAYTLACTTVLMAAGTLADRYGRRRLFVISLLVFGITSLACGLAPDATLLVVSRFLQGLGGGAMLICLIAILSHQFREGRARSIAFGTWGVVFGIGLGFGPIIGGAITSLASWRWVFLIHAPLTAVTLALTGISVQESRDPQAERLDLWGIVTLSAAVFCLTYFIIQGPVLGFGSGMAIGILIASLVCFVLFVLVEKLHSHPMFDFSVFRIRKFSGAICGSIGMNFSFWPFVIYLPIYFQGGLGYDVVTAGLALLTYTLPTLVIPPLAERLSLRYHARVVIPAGMFTIGLGFLLMEYGCRLPHASWLSMLPGCLLAGIGLGLTNTPTTNTTTGSVPASRVGMASAIDISARLITLAINIAMMGFILLQGISNYLKRTLPASFDIASVHAFAEKIASGNLSAVTQSLQSRSLVHPDVIVRAALVNGFGYVTLYGGLGAWILAAISFGAFRLRKACVEATYAD